jgi:hypothetical protein
LKRIRILLIIALLFLALNAKPIRASTVRDASRALSTAESDSVAAFHALRDAQLAGANVTNPSIEFAQGLQYLENARAANASGNYNSAVNQALSASGYFASVQIEAHNLQIQANSDTTIRSILIVTSSILSVMLVTAGYNFAERWWYRRWLRKLPEMRIRLKEDRREED